MTPEPDPRQALREWILAQSKRARPDELRDDTPLIEQRIITSLQIMDLVLFVERLRKRPIDPGMIKGAAFRDINALMTTFFPEAAHAS